MTAPLPSRAVSDDVDDDLEPGPPVVPDSAPLAHAGEVSERPPADLCSTLAEADAATLAAPRGQSAVDAGVIDALRALAERVAITHRIAQRTTDRAALEVGERMADIGVGMVMHPATIRERASAVVDAHARLVQAEELLEAHDVMAAEEAAVPLPPPPPPPSPPMEPVVASAPRPRRFLGFLRRGRTSQLEDTAESTDLLRSIAAATDDVFGARRASAAREAQRALLVVRRDSAYEVVRVAEHTWYDIAGEGADPTNVEDVVRRLDPQHQDALVAAQETVSVRAASTVFDEVVARWQASWAELGIEAPPPTDAEAAVERLTAGAATAVALVGAAAERVIDLTEADPSAVLVVTEGPLLTDA